MVDVALVSANLAGLAIQSLLTGVAIIMFANAFHVLLHKHGLSSRATNMFFKRMMFLIAVFLLTGIVAHWLLTIMRAFDAFVYYIDDPGPFLVYARASDSKWVIQSGIYVALVFVTDCILVYRLYVVWCGNKLVMAFPCCTAAGLLVSGIGVTYEFTRVADGADIFTTTCGRWITSCFSFTLCTNVYSTSMIAFRIWRSIQRVKALRATDTSTLSSAVQVVAESAAIYTAFAIAAFVSYLTQSNVNFTCIDAIVPAVGIAFCLIIIRTDISLPRSSSPNTASHLSTAFHFGGPGSRASTTGDHSSVYGRAESIGKSMPLRTLSMHVTQELDVRDDGYMDMDGERDRGVKSGSPTSSPLDDRADACV